MEIFDLLAEHQALFIALTFAYSLLIGSFLNVVIYRLPIMLEREWRKQAQDILSGSAEAQASDAQAQPAFNLVVPASACPKCNVPIRAWQNIPVISYLFLRGKCANCKTSISPRYPIIELGTALLSAVVAWRFGFTWYCGAALLMTWALVALSMIDFDHQLLPDQIT